MRLLISLKTILWARWIQSRDQMQDAASVSLAVAETQSLTCLVTASLPNYSLTHYLTPLGGEELELLQVRSRHQAFCGASCGGLSATQGETGQRMGGPPLFHSHQPT